MSLIIHDSSTPCSATESALLAMRSDLRRARERKSRKAASLEPLQGHQGYWVASAPSASRLPCRVTSTCTTVAARRLAAFVSSSHPSSVFAELLISQVHPCWFSTFLSVRQPSGSGRGGQTRVKKPRTREKGRRTARSGWRGIVLGDLLAYYFGK